MVNRAFDSFSRLFHLKILSENSLNDIPVLKDFFNILPQSLQTEIFVILSLEARAAFLMC